MNLNLLDPKLIVLVAVFILIIAIAAVLYVRRRRDTISALRKRFGPEYERAVLVHGSERKAEATLADREKRVEELNLRYFYRWSANVTWKNGHTFSLALWILQKARLRKPMTWCLR